MMKSSTVTPNNNRSTSNSQESIKIKKSISSTFNNKMKSQINPSGSSMLYSIKQKRLGT
jgi:hypothetical protein